jgi:hypothetical protein
MTWRENILRTPIWPMVATQFAIGVTLLIFAVLDATVNWDVIEAHDDGLLLLGKAAIGGFAIGIGFELLRRRIAAGLRVGRP